MRSHRLCGSVVLCLGLLQAGCSGWYDAEDCNLGEAGGFNMLSGNNSWALLEGESVEGPSAEPIERVELRVDSPGCGAYAFGPMFAMARSATSSIVVMEVTNDSIHGRCFIQFTEMVYRDDEGAALPSTLNFAYLQGSVGIVGSGDLATATDTCLAPGETGYLLDTVEEPLDRLASVEFVMQDTRNNVAEPTVQFVPQSYTYVPEDEHLTVTGLASGSEGLRIAKAEIVILDAQGDPIGWNGLSRGDEKEAEPGQSLELYDLTFSYAGSTQVVVFTDFVPASLISAHVEPERGLALDASTSESARWRARNLAVSRLASAR